MIKLIASDLDGTLLLNRAQKLEQTTKDLVTALLKKGYKFCSASGRQYANQKRLWDDRKDIYYICENGALSVYQDRILEEYPMDFQTAIAIAEDIQAREGCEVTINTRDTVYLCPKDPMILTHLRDVVHYNVTEINDFSKISEPILKLAVYEQGGIGSSVEYFSRKWSSCVHTMVSGLEWMDFIDYASNKGNALKNLQETLGIAPDETMVFGDNFNDIEMLNQAVYSYAMEHADEAVKRHASGITVRVEQILKTLL